MKPNRKRTRPYRWSRWHSRRKQRTLWMVKWSTEEIIRMTKEYNRKNSVALVNNFFAVSPLYEAIMRRKSTTASGGTHMQDTINYGSPNV